MADDEQFSLCWNNFNSNLSAGFHESLCRGDLVDVTLAAEGQFVKAHRLVLSVCSPYFRKMFTQMPANQHAFVFLKDVSHTALKDLIQFMYCGEVNVKQEALPAFISTAEALQIKGLTDSDPPPSQSPAEPSTPTPQIQQQITSPRVRQRTSTARSYKIETVDDSGDDNKQPTQIVIQATAAPVQTTIAQQAQQLHLQQSHQQQQIVTVAAAPTTTTTTVVTHKRPAQRSLGSSTAGTAPHIKRTKSTIDPLEPSETATTTQQITVQATVVADTKPQQQQQASEPEYIDLPIELPTKSEPDYAEEAGEVDSAEQDGAYVEDDSYGELRYDESYFTENEDAVNTAAAGADGSASSTVATTSKAIVKQQQASFSDSSYVETADQSNNDAQGSLTTPLALPEKIGRKRGRPKQQKEMGPPLEKLMDKITNATKSSIGLPAVYASTTKGGMKLIYEGHHFRYSFRRGEHSVFQCCYKENKEECKVRVVSDQKRVFPLDGEHIHFIQATDKSVTSCHFETADSSEVIAAMKIQFEGSQAAATGTEEQPPPVIIDNELLVEAEAEPEYYGEEVDATQSDTVDANDFREKIKKRLQKALLGKKK